jgi:hypothetical protein
MQLQCYDEIGGGGGGGIDTGGDSGGGGVGGDTGFDPFCIDCGVYNGSPLTLGITVVNVTKHLSFANSSKANCVYDQLKQNNNYFQSLLQSFEAYSGTLNLTFKVASFSTDNDSQTENDDRALTRAVGTSFTNFEIVLNKDWLDNQNPNLGAPTDIEIAKTLIHEAIHAQLEALMTFVNRFPTATAYPGLYPYLEKHNLSIARASHDYMANHRLDALTQAIYEFMPPASGSGLTWNHYQALAWGGLDFDYIDKWMSKTQTEKDSIRDMRNDLKKRSPQNCN